MKMMHESSHEFCSGVGNFWINCRDNDNGGGGNDEEKEEEEDKDEEDGLENNIRLPGGSSQ